MSKEFYHWLAVSDNEAQRVGIRIVAVLWAADFPIGKSDVAKQ